MWKGGHTLLATLVVFFIALPYIASVVFISKSLAIDYKDRKEDEWDEQRRAAEDAASRTAENTTGARNDA